jgi:hypothetical protein
MLTVEDLVCFFDQDDDEVVWNRLGKSLANFLDEVA